MTAAATACAALTGATDGKLVLQAGHTAPVHAVAVTPDGRTVLSAGAHVHLGDLETGARSRVLGGPHDVRHLAIAPDGRTVALAGTDERGLPVVELRDLRRDRTRVTLDLAGPARDVAFAPDGRVLAIAGSVLVDAEPTGGVSLWDADSGFPVDAFPIDTSEPVALAYDARGEKIATAGARGPVAVLDARSGALLHRIASETDGAEQRITDLVFASDGTLVVVGQVTTYGDDGEPRSEGHVRFVEVARERVRNELVGQGRAIHAVAAARRGATHEVATAGDDGSVVLWEADTGRWVAALEGIDVPARALAFDPRHGGVAVGHGRWVRVWDPETGGIQPEWPGRSRIVPGALAVAPHGDSLAVAVEGGVAIFGTRRPELLRWLPGAAAPIGYASTGRLLATGGSAPELPSGRALGGVIVWRPLTGKAQFALPTPPVGRATSLALEPAGGGGRLAVAGGTYGAWTAELRDVESGALARTLTTSTSPTGPVAWSADGRRIAVGRRSEREPPVVDVYDAEVASAQSLPCGEGGATGLALSDDGRLLAIGAWDRSATVHDLVSGRELLRVDGLAGWMVSVALAPDARHVAIVARGATEGHSGLRGDVRVVELASGRTLWKRDDTDVNAAAPPALAFLDEGTLAVAVGDAVELRSAATGELRVTLRTLPSRREGGRPEWIATTPAGDWVGSPAARHWLRFRIGGQTVPDEAHAIVSSRPDRVRAALRGP